MEPAKAIGQMPNFMDEWKRIIKEVTTDGKIDGEINSDLVTSKAGEIFNQIDKSIGQWAEHTFNFSPRSINDGFREERSLLQQSVKIITIKGEKNLEELLMDLLIKKKDEKATLLLKIFRTMDLIILMPYHIEKAYKNKLNSFIENVIENREQLEVELTKERRPLHLACKYGTYEILSILIKPEHNLNLDYRDEKLNTAMHYACKRDIVNMIIRLIQARDGQRIMRESENVQGQIPFHILCASSWANPTQHLSLVDKVIGLCGTGQSFTVLLTKRDKWGLTPFHYACRSGNIAVAMMLSAQAKARNVNIESQYPLALLLACTNGHLDLVIWLTRTCHVVPNIECLQATLQVVPDLPNIADIYIIEKMKYHVARYLILTTEIEYRAKNIRNCFQYFLNKNCEEPKEPILLQREMSTLLHCAAKEDDDDLLNALLKKNVDVNILTEAKNTPLHLAAAHRCLKTSTSLLDKDANAEIENQDGKRAIDLAMENEAYPIVYSFLKRGLTFKDNPQQVNVWKLLKYIFEVHVDGNQNYREIVTSLLSKLEERYLDETDQNGFTLFHIASKAGNHSSLQQLIISAKDKITQYLDKKNGDGDTNLHLAIKARSNSCILELIKQRANMLIEDKNNSTAFDLLSSYKTAEELENALENQKIETGSTLFHALCEVGNASILVELIKKALDLKVSPENLTKWLNTKQTSGDTPVDLALKSDSRDCVGILLNYNARLDIESAKTKVDLTQYLCFACKHRYTNLALALKDEQTLYDYVDPTDGRTAIHWAFDNGLKEISIYLIENLDPIRLSKPDAKGHTPLHLTLLKRRKSFSRKLIMKKVNVNALDNNNRSPLHEALNMNMPKIALKIINENAFPDISDISDYTPIILAVENGFLDIAIALRNKLSVDPRALGKRLTRSGETLLNLSCKKGMFSLALTLFSTRDDIGCQLTRAELWEYALKFGYSSEFGDEEKAMYKAKANEIRRQIGVDDKINGVKFTPLHTSLLLEDSEKAKSQAIRWIKEKIYLEDCDHRQRPPLYIACERGFESIVEILTNKQNLLTKKNGHTILFYALKYALLGRSKTVLQKLSDIVQDPDVRKIFSVEEKEVLWNIARDLQFNAKELDWIFPNKEKRIEYDLIPNPLKKIARTLPKGNKIALNNGQLLLELGSIDKDNLSEVSKCLSNMAQAHLITLVIRIENGGNNWSDLFDFIKVLPITGLYIRTNDFESFSQSLNPLLNSEENKLVYLDFASNYINDNHVNALALSLQTNGKNLTYLNLLDNSITETGAQTICKALGDNIGCLQMDSEYLEMKKSKKKIHNPLPAEPANPKAVPPSSAPASAKPKMEGPVELTSVVINIPNVGLSKYARGFPNIRNSCYINAALQMMFHIPGIPTLINDSKLDNSTLTNLRLIMEAHSKPSINESTLKDYLVNLRNNLFLPPFNFPGNITDQQDSHEFLNKILDLLNWKPITVYKKLEKGSEVINNNPTSESIFSIGLDIGDSNKINFQKKINKYFEIEPVEDKPGWKQAIKIITHPNHLIISLNRFLNVHHKINGMVEFPDNLEVTVEGVQYKIIAYVNHHGNTLHAGHYTACVRFSTSENGSEWVEYDDHKKTISNFNNHSKDVYMVLLEKKA